MSERGVFAVDRGIWSDPDFPAEPFSEREAFIWLVGNAAWKPCRVRVGSVSVDLERGQLAFSTRYMAAAWKWSEARVRRFLGRLVDRATICSKTDARATHVTICNYDKFQRVSMPSDASATHQRRKEEDRETKETTSLRSVDAPAAKSRPKAKTQISEDTQPTERQLQDAYAEGLTLPEIRSEWRGFRDNHLKHGSKFADWPAAWRSWLRNPLRQRRGATGARASLNGRATTADLWANDAANAHSELTGGHDDQSPFDTETNDWHRPGAEAHGRPHQHAPQSAGDHPRQLSPLRLVSGL